MRTLSRGLEVRIHGEIFFVCLCAVGARCHVVVCDYEEGGCLVEENYERDEYFGGILDLY